MSSLQHRLIHDGGLYSTFIRDNASHVTLSQASMLGHHRGSCPHEEKVVTDGTIARVVLMFLRDLLERPTLHQSHPEYRCPMARCRKPFLGHLQLIQHLLSCHELHNGVFHCDKCNTLHEFPTNEKDWAHWTGWKHQEVNVERKRSLGSKMRDTFTLRKRDNTRKTNTLSEIQTHQHGFMLHARTHTAASMESVVQGTSMIGCPTPHSTMPFSGHSATGDFFSLHKQPTTTDMMDASLELFRQGFSAEEMSDLQSAVSSITASSTIEVEPSQRASTNTSRTTLFPPRLSHYQSPTPPIQGNNNNITSQPYQFTSQPTIPTGTLQLDGLPPPTAMSLDDPIAVTSVPVTQTSIPPAMQVDGHSWWSPRTTGGIQGLTPDSSGTSSSFHVQTPPAMTLSSTGGRDIPTPDTLVKVRDTDEPQHQIYYQPGTHHQDIARSPSLDSVETMQPNTTLIGTGTCSEMGQQSTPGEGNPTPSCTSNIALSPPSEHQHQHQNHHQHSHPHRTSTTTTGIAIHHRRPNNTTQQDLSLGLSHGSGNDNNDLLICDECQWKPRGVRENLKGYLRKHKNTHKGLRLSCDVPGCTKTFSRLDNLKKHKEDKHGIDDATTTTTIGGGGGGGGIGVGGIGGIGGGGGGLLPLKRVAYTEEGEEQGGRVDGVKRPDTSDSQQRLRDLSSGDYTMLWPALHF
ncbi:hypothetical protein B0H65DRAFT_562324 [Neurospora tetraspora]|uniref:C2H2-type domain-containing protein n=1 Tax=Neurospora tetraspora TaxID=94610 RepID=A0AAE0JNE7_9PEZI|nr:hypothetical protein B0H65DRAFT_562324 [Neurospora tetraspora]